MNHGIRKHIAGRQALKRGRLKSRIAIPIAVPTAYHEDCTREDEGGATYVDVANVRQYHGPTGGISYIVWVRGRVFAVKRITTTILTIDGTYESLV
jgi:hypothetical protein